MKILLATRDNPYESLTGVATYVRNLAKGLMQNGHSVSHIYGSFRSRYLHPYLDWSERYGVSAVNIVNSPLHSPLSQDNPMQDARHPMLEQLFEEALLRIMPDLIHIHDTSGTPASIVLVAKKHHCPVAITFHDFWPFCRQLAFVRPGLLPCEGSDGGRNCALYCSAPPQGLRRLLQHLEAIGLPYRLREKLRRIARLRPSINGQGGSQFVNRVSAPRRLRADSHVESFYVEREALIREALVSATTLLTVSQFAKSMYIKHGYPPHRIRVVSLSSSFADRVRRRLRKFRGYPVRFGFLGRVTPWKGAHVLAEAIRGIPPECGRFTFYGAVEDRDRRFLTSLSGGHPGIQFHGRYTYDQLEKILSDMDVMIFPSVMSESFGLVGLEAQASGLPVIGSDLGAIPEFVEHGINGLLFSPGIPSSLRAEIMRVIQQPDLISHLSANARTARPMKEHISEIERVYQEAVTPALSPTEIRT